LSPNGCVSQCVCLSVCVSLSVCMSLCVSISVCFSMDDLVRHGEIDMLEVADVPANKRCVLWRDSGWPCANIGFHNSWALKVGNRNRPINIDASNGVEITVHGSLGKK